MYQTRAEQQETLCWAVLAAHLNGAADSRKYGHLDTDTIVRHIEHGDVFDFLRIELGQDVAYALGRLTDVHRHLLVTHWRMMASGFDASQFHLRHSGLALLVGYLLHLIQNRHVRSLSSRHVPLAMAWR